MKTSSYTCTFVHVLAHTHTCTCTCTLSITDRRSEGTVNPPVGLEKGQAALWDERTQLFNVELYTCIYTYMYMYIHCAYIAH